VLDEVHRPGGRIMPQLWHVGMMRTPGHGPNPEVAPIGPSGLVKLAGWVKRLTGRPTITVGAVGLDGDFMAGDGGVASADRFAERRLKVARGEADLVAVGRALLADPAWAAKLRDGRTGEFRPYTREAVKTLA
jgi:2,4-dienoyl-CoA reductase-like NADH-dependent reductase (Old Yellow Enzyme family)